LGEIVPLTGFGFGSENTSADFDQNMYIREIAHMFVGGHER
jgi:hypothetical protein